jgi:hypothetical protein
MAALAAFDEHSFVPCVCAFLYLLGSAALIDRRGHPLKGLAATWVLPWMALPSNCAFLRTRRCAISEAYALPAYTSWFSSTCAPGPPPLYWDKHVCGMFIRPGPLPSRVASGLQGAHALAPFPLQLPRLSAPVGPPIRLLLMDGPVFWPGSPRAAGQLHLGSVTLVLPLSQCSKFQRDQGPCW